MAQDEPTQDRTGVGSVRRSRGHEPWAQPSALEEDFSSYSVTSILSGSPEPASASRLDRQQLPAAEVLLLLLLLLSLPRIRAGHLHDRQDPRRCLEPRSPVWRDAGPRCPWGQNNKATSDRHQGQLARLCVQAERTGMPFPAPDLGPGVALPGPRLSRLSPMS